MQNHNEYLPYYRQSIESPDTFWDTHAQTLRWQRPYDKVLQADNPIRPRWFVGGQLNLCDNALDRHVEAGLGDKPAIIWECPELSGSEVWSFSETLDEVKRLSSLMHHQFGISKGDRVVIYMPMIPQALVAMLACARLGAIHVVVFSGYPSTPLAQRIADAEPSLILTACNTQRGGRLIPIHQVVEQAYTQLDRTLPTLVWDRQIDPDFQLDQGHQHNWRALLTQHQPDFPCATIDAEDPAFILYTAGSDGRPDGVVHKVGSYTVAITSSMEHFYNCGPNDVFWSTSDIGWIVGHSYIAYGPMLHGIPTLLYEGTPLFPHAGVWWEVAEKHNVTIMFSAPTAMRILKRYPQDSIEKAKLSLRYIFLAGERCDAAIQEWSTERFGIPVIDHYWQTESGWSITGLHMGVASQTPTAGSAGRPCLGWQLQVVDESGTPLPPETEGLLIGKAPLPPGTFADIWGAPERYDAYFSHFEGMYSTFDRAMMREDGTYKLLGRHDRIVNIAGHRIALASIEHILRSHPSVKAVVGHPAEDKIKTEAIACSIVVEDGIKPDLKLKKQLKAFIREKIGGIAVPRDLDFVEQLPTE
ncbi:MAG TPA: propionyl-CoA synthetase [Myxococcales bacterium]|nr:propionyl-CoA synthetase [Deltaproteobacteria bacterium]MBU48192.1 propionyl-CoA synthetase [Deltaproteobacteria bacterium]HAA54538.1 propionyl-CoA synthetase [Myxococcales bacterium]